MPYSKAKVSILLVFSEVCYLNLFYLALCTALELPPLINLWGLMLMAAGLTLVNLLFSESRSRYLTIGLVNLALFALGAALVSGDRGFLLFSPPKGLNEIINYLGAYLLVWWTGIRSLLLVFRPVRDAYGHFDINMLLTFIPLLLAALGNLALPGAMTWLAAAIFINLLILYQINNTRREESGITLWALILAALLIVLMAAEAGPVLSYLREPSGFVLTVVWSVLKPIGNFLTFLLVAILRFSHQMPADSSGSEYREKPPESGLTPENANPAWLSALMNIFFWLITAVVVVFLALTLFYLGRKLLLWLLRRRNPDYSPVSFRQLFNWRELISFILGQTEKLFRIFRLFLPVSIRAALAYRYLLWWGSRKKCPRRPYETPGEYRARLAARYPAQNEVLSDITSSFVQYRYAPHQDDTTHRDERPDLRAPVRKLYFKQVFSFKHTFTRKEEKECQPQPSHKF